MQNPAIQKAMYKKTQDENLRLANRSQKLPADIAYLLEKYPRETWQGHKNLGQLSQFWLQRHNMFRELGGMLKTLAHDYRETPGTPRHFQQEFAPRLNFFLNQLNGHHQIEDHNYFPVFRALDKRLIIGFDLLEEDHEYIHQELFATAEVAQQFLEALTADFDTQRRAADAYLERSDRLLNWLLRHLDDEEDLFVPVILDRTEQVVGLV